MGALVQWHSLLNTEVHKMVLKRRKGLYLEVFLLGHFAAMFMAGERGTPIPFLLLEVSGFPVCGQDFW